jgi:hypothetical protein
VTDEQRTLSDEEITTTQMSGSSVLGGGQPTALGDADGTDADGTDADGTEADGTDGDATDVTDGDAADADGTDR